MRHHQVSRRMITELGFESRLTGPRCWWTNLKGSGQLCCDTALLTDGATGPIKLPVLVLDQIRRTNLGGSR